MGSIQEKQATEMIDDILNLIFGFIDGTIGNDKEAIEKLKVIEREKLKHLKRK